MKKAGLRKTKLSYIGTEMCNISGETSSDSSSVCEMSSLTVPTYKLKFACNGSFDKSGIKVSPNEFTLGDTIKISYKGSLAQNGANEIYAHMGYGNSEWENVTNLKMYKSGDSYEATFPLTSLSKLNIVFKDSDNNWDNNDGNNYSLNTKPSYASHGVNISPIEFSLGDEVTLTYNGALYKNGALDLYAHIGYGDNDWENIEDMQMCKTSKGFKVSFSVPSTSNLKVAFKDSYDNWDNNSGNDYKLY